MTQGELAKDMSYGENYISEMLGKNGVLSEKFVSAFKIKYRDILENPNHASKQSIDNLSETILILTRNNERLTKLLEEKINSASTGKASVASPAKNNKRRSSTEQTEAFVDKPGTRYSRKKTQEQRDKVG